MTIPEGAAFIAYSGDAGEIWLSEIRRMFECGYNGDITIRTLGGTVYERDAVYPFHPLEVGSAADRWPGADFMVRGLVFIGSDDLDYAGDLPAVAPEEMWAVEGLEGLADALVCPGVHLVEYPVGWAPDGAPYVVGFYVY